MANVSGCCRIRIKSGCLCNFSGVFVILVILYFRRVPVSTGYTHFKADDFEVMAA